MPTFTQAPDDQVARDRAAVATMLSTMDRAAIRAQWVAAPYNTDASRQAEIALNVLDGVEVL